MTPTLTLQERARAARAEHRRRAAEWQDLTTQRIREYRMGLLSSKLSALMGQPVVVTTERLTLDGVTFGLADDYRGQPELYLFEHCQECGQETPVAPIRSLWVLGEYLEAEQRDVRCRDCRPGPDR